MNRTFCSIVVSAVLLLGESSQTAYAQSSKTGVSHTGGMAASHMSEKGSANTNAQWSTDSERGRLRAEARHALHKKGESRASKKSSGDLPAKAKSGSWDH